MLSVESVDLFLFLDYPCGSWLRIIMVNYSTFEIVNKSELLNHTELVLLCLDTIAF